MAPLLDDHFKHKQVKMMLSILAQSLQREKKVLD